MKKLFAWSSGCVPPGIIVAQGSCAEMQNANYRHDLLRELSQKVAHASITAPDLLPPLSLCQLQILHTYRVSHQRFAEGEAIVIIGGQSSRLYYIPVPRHF
jgi:hypothetical protein